MPDLFFQIVLLAAASITAQWCAWRLHVPAILFLLGLGFVLGPMTGLLQPKLLLGDALSPAVSAAVAIILFEGALHLRLADLREARGGVRRIIFIGAPVGCALISAAAYYIGGLELAVAITLGGMLVVTGPTVIMPMLRHALLNPRTGAILKWEGIVNDPIGVIFAVLAYEYFLLKETTTSGFFVFTHGAIIVMVTIGSYAAAHLVKRLFERGLMPEYLKAPFVLTVVLGIFYLSNLMLHESGLIAVTVLGMTLANIHTASIEEIRRFKETITLLLVSGVFLLLTANLDPATLLDINLRSVLFIIALLFVVRPLTAALCFAGSNLSWKEILLVGWIAPRGVVCAAMAGVLGPSLVNAGFEDGNQIIAIAFGVVLASVILHSLTIKPLAERLNLKTKETGGLMISGTQDWALQLAEVLKQRQVPVLVVDNRFYALKEARMKGLPTYYGELLSEEAEFEVEMVKYGSLIAATSSPAYNALLCDKFGNELGREHVFRVRPDKVERSERVRLKDHIRGRMWAREDFSSELLHEMFADGWRFRISRVGVIEKEKERTLILPKESDELMIVGIIGKNNAVRLRIAGVNLNPKEGELLLTFSKNGKEPAAEMENKPAQSEA
jgi:NhaP-type Na+/H+ or K+/H+ antiporter